jgi:hypothetical protein
MGDVLTHGGITSHVKEQLKLVFKPGMIPDADYTYIELGNFLTDVKQFRDPVAYHRGRVKARDVARKEAGKLAGVAGIDNWANSMFGLKDPGPRHGLLPEFLALLAYAFTHQVFDPDGLTRLTPPPGGVPLVPAHPIDPFDVERVIQNQFDQYWPHDHLDFPPIGDAVLARHRELPLFKRQRSGFIGFLERYIAYLSEEFTKLEFEWATANVSPGSNAESMRRDFLVRLGVLLHAVEDYFFHSNFIELRQWQVLRRKFSDVDPTTADGRATIFGQGLWGTRLAGTVQLKRILYRRLRYPIIERNGEFSSEASEDSTELLYTGGFYLKDIFHTLGGALEAIERYAELLLAGEKPADSKLVLVRLAFVEEARRELVRGGDEAAKSLRAQHAEQLKKGEYIAAIARLRERGRLSEQAAERLRQAFEFDQRSEEDFGSLPGAGGVLVSLLADLQRERDLSHDKSGLLNLGKSSIVDEASSNGAPTENVGTHSLLSKDSDDKEPFREEAVVLAKHASAGVATVLARRLMDPFPLDVGVDWLAVLRFFIRFPKHVSMHWEEELLDLLRRAGISFRQPNVDALADKPKVPFLGTPHRHEVLLERRAGKIRAELEDYYRDFETNPT